MGILKAAGRGLELATSGRVTAQREDVFDAALPGLGEDGSEFVLRRVDAGEMHHRGEAVLALDAVHDADGLLPRAAARAVGHGAEVRAELHQLRDVFLEEVLLALVGLRREELERDDGLAQSFFAACMSRMNRMRRSVAGNGGGGKIAVFRALCSVISFGGVRR